MVDVPQIAASASKSWDVGGTGSVPATLGAVRYNLLTIGITNDESYGNALLATAKTADGFVKNPASIKGQTIVLTANSTGDYAVQSDSSGETDQPREHRSREGSREGSRGGRKPRREREPRAAKGSESSEREPRPAKHSDKGGEREPRHAKGAGRNADRPPQAASAAFTPPAPAQASRVPSIGRPEPRRAQRDVESEPADHSHLPAFLLRPVRARV